MANLKPYYDAAQQAEALVQATAQRIDDLFNSGKSDDALKLRDELESAKAKAKEANDLYLSMRSVGDASDPARKLVAGIVDLNIGMSDNDLRNYSLLRAIRAAANAQNDPRAWNEAGLELEASRAMADKLGREPKGFFVPFDVQAAKRVVNTQKVGDPTTGGYLKAAELLAESFIDILRNKMVMRQAGATVMTGLVGDIDIPKKTTGSTAYWIGEGSSPTKSTLVFGQVAGRPRTVAAYVQLTRRFLKQSSLDAEAMVRDDLASTLALAVDYASLHGVGAANEPMGLQYLSGIGSQVGGTNGAAPTWGNIVGLETEVATDNADFGRISYVTNAKVRGKLRQTYRVANTDTPVWSDDNTMNGYPAYVTNQVRSNLTKGNQSLSSAIFFGNWADLVFLFWGGLDVIVDPYTNSTSGDVLITAMQDADIIFRRAQSFAAMLDALTA